MRFIVLTPEETRALIFIAAMFVVGLTTKHYRKQHRIPPSRSGAPHAQTASSPAADDE